MKKKDIKIIIFTIIGVIVIGHLFPIILELTSEFIDRTSPQPTVMAIGPNRFDEEYFFRTICADGDHPKTGMKRLNLDTHEDTVVFEVEDKEHDRIKTFEQEGNSVYLTVDRVGSEPEEVKYYVNPEDGICEVVEDSDEDDNDPSKIHHIYEDEQTIEHEMEDGSTVTIQKTFGKEDFLCTVGGKVYTIDVISNTSNRYAKITNLYDSDGMIYGMITVPKQRISENDMKVVDSSFDIKREEVFRFDPATGESEYIYGTNSGRIVGYTQDRVYVMRGRKIKTYYNVNVRFVQEDAGSNLGWSRNMAVKWLGKRAVVYDFYTGEILGMIEGK